MSPAFATRRRAERFDALVSRPGPADGASDELADLLDVVARLRDLPEVAPSADFSADLRERLMAEADTALAVAPVTGPRAAAGPDVDEARLLIPARSRGRDRRVAAVVGGIALVGATTSMAVAAQTALPGDSLYPVKRAIEQAQTAVRTDDASRGTAMLAHAEGRLDEVDALTLRGTAEGIAAVPGTLEEFRTESEEAGDLLLDAYQAGDADGADGGDASLTRLRDFTGESITELEALEARLPGVATDEIVAAARTLTRLDDRARELCPSCGTGITSLPRFLLNAGMAYDVAPPTSSPATSSREARSAGRGDRQRQGRDRRRGARGVDVPDVEIGDDTSATGDAGDATRDGGRVREQRDGTDAGTGTTDDPTKPLRDATREVTRDLTGDRRTSRDQPLDDVVKGLEDTVDKTLDGTRGLLD